MSKSELIEWMRAEFKRGRKSGEIFAEASAEMLKFSTIPLNFGTFPDPRQEEREWIVFSTSMAECWLMLECRKTGAQGVVKDPTKTEWSDAFTADINPYAWLDGSRVTLMHE